VAYRRAGASRLDQRVRDAHRRDPVVRRDRGCFLTPRRARECRQLCLERLASRVGYVNGSGRTFRFVDLRNECQRLGDVVEHEHAVLADDCQLALL
jgi:hypothetical protein